MSRRASPDPLADDPGGEGRPAQSGLPRPAAALGGHSEGKSGALLNFNSAPDVARAQALARQIRLKIPPLFGLDVLHGFRTQFPLPLGEAAAFSPRFSRLASEWAAKEAAYVGVNWTFAPMADLSRDSRWGRIVEGFGEDP